MKRFVMTIALTCFLAISALAGEIPSGGITAPPPDETTSTTSAPAPGDVPSGGFTQQISEAAFDLFQLVLGGIV
jgi:hypothetical protein